MKKAVVFLIALSVALVGLKPVFAIDICTNDPLEYTDFNVEITSAVYLRDLSCMDSNIITTIPQGEIVRVIGKVEGWHKIERSEGTTGWVWETFVRYTDKPLQKEIEEETYDPDPDPDPMHDIAGHKYEDAIWYVYDRGIVSGYPDGSFKPDNLINRAELLKIVVESAYGDEFQDFESNGCFKDVPAEEWYFRYVCFAKSKDLVEGYPDDSFQPARNINFVESLKIIMVGFGYEYVEGDPWYENILETANSKGYVIPGINDFGQKMTRGEIAETIKRVMNDEKQD